MNLKDSNASIFSFTFNRFILLEFAFRKSQNSSIRNFESLKTVSVTLAH
jgi:hypothetical protein